LKKLSIAAMDVRCDLSSGRLRVDGESLKPGIRKLGDLKDVLRDPSAVNAAENETPVYFMYRDVRRGRDASMFKKNSLRYDMTVIPPRILGTEYVKTAGHYHPIAEGGLSFPEVYQVLNGSASFLLQKREDGVVSEVILVQAERGEWVIIPPNYGHVTVNRSKATLVLANLVSSLFESLYEPMRASHGGAYYMLVGGKIAKNPAYRNPPRMQSVYPNQRAMGAQEGDIYSAFLVEPTLFRFLNHPRDAPAEPFRNTIE
jgi:glucose-6-phosphate isomerase